MTLNRPANPRADRPWLAYLQLLRLPNVFTAWADVSMGYLLATGGHASWRVFVFVFVFMGDLGRHITFCLAFVILPFSARRNAIGIMA